MATAVSNPSFTFDEQLHLYRGADGVVIPSVTQAMKASGLISFDGISPRVLERKRQLGSLVHRVTELCDKDEDLDDFEIPDEVMPYLEGYVNFRNDSGFVPDLIEQRMLGEIYGMFYGMTPDRTGPVNGVGHVIELKCGACEHPAWGVQLAAYDLGLNHRSTLARAAVQLGPQFPRNYKLHPYTEPVDYQVWASSLATTLWKQNKKLLVLEALPERLEAA